MNTITATGFSSDNDPIVAFRNAAITAKSLTGQTKHNLVMVAVTSAYADVGSVTSRQALDALRTILNPEQLIGLTTPALITASGIENKGVQVLAISSDDIDFNTAVQTSVSLLPLQETGLKFGRALSTASDRHGAIVFCDTLSLNHTQIIHGMQEGLGRAFILAGAINPGGIFHQDQLVTDALGGVIFGGKTSFATAIRHGWQPLGKPRVIDDSNSNLIRRIDGKPAVSIYQDYFPEALAALPTGQMGDIGFLYPLGLSTERAKEYIIKSPSSVLPDGSLVCQGEVPRGTPIHLMIGDKDSCRQAAHDAAVSVRDQLHGRHPKVIFIFASLSRKKLFGRAAMQEISQIKEILGVACPVFGMYTYGEFGAVTSLDLQTHNAGILVAGLG